MKTKKIKFKFSQRQLTHISRALLLYLKKNKEKIKNSDRDVEEIQQYCHTIDELREIYGDVDAHVVAPDDDIAEDRQSLTELTAHFLEELETISELIEDDPDKYNINNVRFITLQNNKKELNDFIDKKNAIVSLLNKIHSNTLDRYNRKNNQTKKDYDLC